jgi:SAM-dependent methyltransferase
MTGFANAEMAQAWDGAEGAYWADNAASFERTTGRFWARLRAQVPVAADERAIDIGCGNGANTCDLAQATADGHVLGVDLSQRMLDNARRRAAALGISNVEFVHGDAQVHAFERGTVTLVVSSFGCMFFADPVAAFRNVGSALTGDGRLALLAWRELARNEWVTAIRATVAPELPPPPADVGPFAWANAEMVRDVLSAAGFADIDFTSIDAVADMGADPDAAFTFMSSLGLVRGLLEQVGGADADERLARLRAELERRTTPDGVLLPASAWLITARRTGG